MPIRAGLGKVRVAGAERPDVLRWLERVTVEREVYAAGVARLTLTDPDFGFMDRVFDPEKRVPVEVELGAWPRTQLVFSGSVEGLDPRFPRSGAPGVTVICHDASIKLREAERTRTWEGVTDADLIREIAGEYGLQAEVDVEPTVFEHVSQVRETDMRFLERRALLRGYDIFVTGTRLVVRRRERRTPRHVLEYRGLRHNLAEFRPRWRTLTNKRETVVLSWDPGTKSPVIGKASELEQVGGREVIVEEKPASRADAVRLALASREEAEIRSIEGDAVPEPPLHDLAPGDVVEVRGVGRRFSGHYFVAAIVDTWDNQGLNQKIRLQQALELEEREAGAVDPGAIRQLVASAKGG